MAVKAWSKRIEAAEKRGHFTERDINDAADWATCAIGERHGWSGDAYQMTDDENELGVQFCEAVSELDDFADARAVYAKIQALPAEVSA